jgi:1-acyl-sn-glycerol-3-phosphate acyltransferase
VNDAQKLSREQTPPKAKFSDPALPQWFINLTRLIVNIFSRLFWGVEHKGVENIPEDTGVILAANHQSYGDPFWLAIPVKRPIRFLAWSEAFSWPLVGKAIGLFGAWPLHVEGSDPSAIRRSLNWLRNGGVVVIFPEGGRGLPDGSMIRLKRGAVRMALEADVPILPVTVRGANRVWPSNQRLPRFGKVEVIYHPVMQIEQLPGEETRACAKRETERLAKIIQSAL